ncbi:hypothetical protein D0C36_09125 [Mucilaginibacter conchicola]|uniref:Uncharacterized protein n=1 Tax=Mucilaginibacter conchicola TaxID=2303333 RepID=A0A372NZX0_9SPHI|nr:hypothetical protein D0C36_09125 [Mucilaginibacter conchicola]
MSLYGLVYSMFLESRKSKKLSKFESGITAFELLSPNVGLGSGVPVDGLVGQGVPPPVPPPSPPPTGGGGTFCTVLRPFEIDSTLVIGDGGVVGPQGFGVPPPPLPPWSPPTPVPVSLEQVVIEPTMVCVQSLYKNVPSS